MRYSLVHAVTFHVYDNIFTVYIGPKSARSVDWFCSSLFVFKRNLSISAISASLSLSTKLTFFRPCPICSSSPTIKARFSKPVSCTLPSESTMASQSKNVSIYDFTVKDTRNDVDLSSYKGKVLLIVNVASQCGLTNSNYTELNQIYEKYKNQGLEILAFPCNQFGGEEPGSKEQIQG